ncbi:MAG: hypothetical protein JXR10_14430 [Cyclobacteriaceae bacterium]
MDGSSKIKTFSLWLMAGFYVFAGANHFINPEFYLPLIPPYLPNPQAINVISGIAEILLGVGLLFPQLRRFSSIGIILMLMAFIPSHVYFIAEDSCLGDLCVDNWVGIARLVVVHPLLILWAKFNI